MIGVAQITNVPLVGVKIQNISNFHSIEFCKDYMRMWRYYDIGEGLKQPYNNLSVKPSIKLLIPYHKADKRTLQQIGKQKAEKKREDRQLCTLVFCQEIGCRC